MDGSMTHWFQMTYIVGKQVFLLSKVVHDEDFTEGCTSREESLRQSPKQLAGKLKKYPAVLVFETPDDEMMK